MRRCWLAALLGLVTASLSPGGVSAQEEAVKLTDWVTAIDGARFNNSAGVLLRSSGGSGWIRTQTVFEDFTLKIDYRIVNSDAEAAVIFRAVMTRPTAWPVGGYRLLLGENLAATDVERAVTSYSEKIHRVDVTGAARQAAPQAMEGWQQLEIRCEGDRITLSLNGGIVGEFEGAEWLAGYVGIEAVRGDVEFRNIALTRLPTGLKCDDTRAGVDMQLPGTTDAGIVGPRPQTQVSARYTMEAMQRKVQGNVLLNFVVETDGSVGAVCVARGLDPELDTEAVASLKRWRFNAATRDGQPIRVHAVMSANFKLQ